MSERNTCSGCVATWTGTSPCHCASCHLTFGGIGLFDAHRHQRGERGGCIPPDQVTNSRGERVMFQRDDGVYRGPEMTAEQKAAAFGARS